MIGVRLNSLAESGGAVGEPDQDANSALTELDKGLRSGKVGEQCEAIVRFPRLFEKYPFPILINSSFLKLADVFRVGNNFLRLWVLRVCQQSEKHLDKILNVDEFVRRVFSVLHSNDPVARALALRTLGAVAGIIPERRRVQHALRSALDSHDSVEVDAALQATVQFAAHSNAFAVSMCNKLSDMVECEATNAERRARVVRALRYVHGGAVRAHGVLRLLRSLLVRFPSATSARAAVAAIAAIADDTVVHVPDQALLLTQTAQGEARGSVRRAALCGLARLARHAALWPPECVRALFALPAAGHSQDTLICLQIMQELVKCPSVCAGSGPQLLAMHSLCREAVLSTDLRVAAAAADVLTSILRYRYQEGISVEDSSEVMPALESLVIATGLPNEQSNTRPLRIALRCMVQLCNTDAQYTARVARALGGQVRACTWRGWYSARHEDATDPISELNEAADTARAEALLEALCALGGGPQAGALEPAVPALLHKLRAILTAVWIDGLSCEGSGAGVVLLCTALLQAAPSRNGKECMGRIKAFLHSGNGWTHYRVARAALRYGHCSLAAELLEMLARKAPSEATHRWLSSLHRAASADLLLEKEGIAGLEGASAGWERAAGAGGGTAEGGGACAAGCAGCGSCVSLCGGWLCARAAWLACLAGAARAARSVCTQPPPAIAHAQAQAARDPATRAGACVAAVRRARTAALACAQQYAHLARTAFHADAATLRHLHIQQHTCELLAQLMERITTANYQERREVGLGLAGGEWRPRTLEERLQLATCDKIEDITRKLFNSPDTKPGVTHRHMAALLAGVRACCVRAVWPRGAFAGGGAAARCRVSLSPSGAHGSEHATTLNVAHHLALNIQGVILPVTQPRKHQEKRQVKGVQLTVTSTPQTRTDKGVAETTAVQTVAPVRDFFSAQQLVSVGAPGLHTVCVETALIDQDDAVWLAGPRTSVLVKAHEDPTTKGNAQGARARF